MTYNEARAFFGNHEYSREELAASRAEKAARYIIGGPEVIKTAE